MSNYEKCGCTNDGCECTPNSAINCTVKMRIRDRAGAAGIAIQRGIIHIRAADRRHQQAIAHHRHVDDALVALQQMLGMGAEIAVKRVIHGVAHHKIDTGAGRDLPPRALLLFRMGAVGGPVGPVTLGLAGGCGELRLMQQRHPPRKRSLDPADPGGLIAEVRPLNARRGLYGGADCLVVEDPGKGEGIIPGRLPAQALLPTLKTDQHTDENRADTGGHGGFPPVPAYGKGDSQNKAEHGWQEQQPLRCV